MIGAQTQTIGSVYKAASQRFAAAGFESPELEARVLLAGLLRRSSTDLFLSMDEALDDASVRQFESFVDRRIRREPAAYVIGTANFMGYEFIVNKNVLVPRPETELLVEDLLMEARDRSLDAPTILDVGTGSGCIAVSLALSLPKARIFAVDLSPEALKVAESNARRLDVTINFFQSDLLKDLRSNVSGGFDMIAANPPYVAATDLPHLAPELSYEPRLALDGGQDGFDVVRRLVPEGFSFLKPGGVLAMEIGHDQGGAVGALFSQAGFEDVCILKDYSGLDRIAKGRKRGSI